MSFLRALAGSSAAREAQQLQQRTRYWSQSGLFPLLVVATRQGSVFRYFSNDAPRLRSLDTAWYAPRKVSVGLLAPTPGAVARLLSPTVFSVLRVPVATAYPAPHLRGPSVLSRARVSR